MSRQTTLLHRSSTNVPSTPGQLGPLTIVRASDARYQPVIAAWGKLIQIISQPRGRQALRTVVCYWSWDQENQRPSNDPEFVRIVDVFVRKIRATTPMLIIDDTMQSSVTAFHPRGEWEGDYSDFQPQRQALLFNGQVSDVPLHR